jgi:transcription initiation factor IIF auxiliary subunit
MNNRVFLLLWIAAMALGLCLTAISQTARAQELSAANTAAYAGDGRWNWSAYIQASPEALRRIRCVEYTLHPTFPEPVRRVCAIGNAAHPFALSSNGWGVFEIGIRVMFNNGEERLLRHMLRFETPQTGQALPISAANTARQLRPDLWEWTVFITGPNEALGQVRCVEYTLHPSFPNPVKTICERGAAERAFPLSANGWGIFSIGIRIILRDGRVQNLTYTLRF